MNCGIKIGRGEWIRTTGLYVPNVALYQAKLHLAKIKPSFMGRVFFYSSIFFGAAAVFSRYLKNASGQTAIWLATKMKNHFQPPSTNP